MEGDKITRQMRFTFLDQATECVGYEIHMGRTEPLEGADPSPLARLSDGRADGYWLDDRCMGTYLHGILDNPSFVDYLLAPFADKISGEVAPLDYEEYKEIQYNRLADHLRAHIDVPLIYKLMSQDD